MKILLVYPSTLDAGKTVKFRKAFLPPLNLAILDRLTEQANPEHEVNIINDCVETIDFGMPCDLVGITAITSQAMRAYQIADRFRSQGVTVVLGGVHPSLLPQEAMNHADAVVVGEAEKLWPEILSDFEAGRLKTLYTSTERP
ncbi:MAG: cobalamin-dependent protein, partial [Desulfobacteraceae bacterium]